MLFCYVLARRVGAAYSTPPPAMPIFGDLQSPGALRQAVQSTSRSGELVLLHADKRRLRLLVNLVAELAAWQVHHVLVLGFSSSVCTELAASGDGSLGCAHSSYLQTGRPAQQLSQSLLTARQVAWLQRFHLLRRLVEEERVNVLALDTDITVHAEP